MNSLLLTFLMGIGATALTDVWGLLRQPLLGIAPPDYGLVGRWIAHMAHGRFRHDSIAAAPAITGERVVGWTAHYVIGVAFAALLVVIWGESWIQHPRLGPALWVGVMTVAAPFLLLQPGMGAGLAARLTPRPWMARLQSVLMHLVFGVGLYGSAWALNFLTTFLR